MQRPLRPARTETYEHTITGLLGMRRELMKEAERIRDRLAEIRNDIMALDRTLGTLGYEGSIEAAMPRHKRHVIFGRGELIRAILDELRGAGRPLRSREIAKAIVAVQENDPRDQKYIADLTRRVGKALRSVKDYGDVKAVHDAHGGVHWQLR